MKLSIIERIILKSLPAESQVRELIILGVKDRIYVMEDLLEELKGDLALDPSGETTDLPEQILDAQKQLDELNKLMLQLNRR